MIPQGDRVESVLEPAKSVFGMRTSVHQVPDTENPIATGVKPELGKGPTEGPKTSVHVADDQVSTGPVDPDSTSYDGLALTFHALPLTLMNGRMIQSRQRFPKWLFLLTDMGTEYALQDTKARAPR